jgi:isocitrate/isopropylmalate dehydrogenase
MAILHEANFVVQHVLQQTKFASGLPPTNFVVQKLTSSEHVVQHVRVLEYASQHVVQQCSYVALPAKNLLYNKVRFWSATNEHVVQHVRLVEYGHNTVDRLRSKLVKLICSEAR